MVPGTSMIEPARPIRVLHVFGAMNRGGAEMRTLELMRAVDRTRVAMEFCALLGAAGSLDGEIVALGGAVHACKLDVGFAPRFVRLIRDRRIDVVHSHVHLSSGFILAVARAAGVRRRIAHFRSTSDGRGQSLGRRAYRAAMRRLLDLNATDILGVSEGCLHEGWSPTWARDPRCRVMYSGVAPERFVVPDARASVRTELGLAPGAPLVVQVGRFDPPKNHPFAADIIAALPDAHVVFVGRGGTALEAETRRRLHAAGAAARAHFVGERCDVPRWLCGADVSMLPSVLEGLPGVVLESLAAGTPVVASDLSGVREIAARLPGVDVCRVDAPAAAWADKLAAALRAPAADRVTLRARFAASAFSLASASAAHLALWTRSSG